MKKIFCFFIFLSSLLVYSQSSYADSTQIKSPLYEKFRYIKKDSTNLFSVKHQSKNENSITFWVKNEYENGNELTLIRYHYNDETFDLLDYHKYSATGKLEKSNKNADYGINIIPDSLAEYLCKNVCIYERICEKDDKYIWWGN